MVTVVKFGFDNARAVDAGAVGRIKIAQFELTVFSENHGVVMGNSPVFKANHVVEGASESDSLFNDVDNFPFENPR